METTPSVSKGGVRVNPESCTDGKWLKSQPWGVCLWLGTGGSVLWGEGALWKGHTGGGGEARKEAGPCLGGRSMHSGLLVLPLPPVFLDSHRSPASDSAAQVRGLSRFPHSSFGRKPLMPWLKQLSQQPSCDYEEGRGTRAWHSCPFFLLSLCIDKFFKIIFSFQKSNTKDDRKISPSVL